MKAHIQARARTAPPTWRHISFVVYEFISLLSWTLWTQSTHPAPPLLSSCPPVSQLLPAKEGRRIQYGYNKGELQRKNVGGGRKGLKSDFSMLLVFLDGCLASLPDGFVKVSAAWRAGLFWHLSNGWLFCPSAKKEKAGRTAMGTAGLVLIVVLRSQLALLIHTRRKQKVWAFLLNLDGSKIQHCVFGRMSLKESQMFCPLKKQNNSLIPGPLCCSQPVHTGTCLLSFFKWILHVLPR